MDTAANAIALEHITPDFIASQHVATRNLQQLIEEHLKTIRGKDFLMLSEEEFLNYVPEVKKKFFEHSVRNGILRKLSPAEVRNLVG